MRLFLAAAAAAVFVPASAAMVDMTPLYTVQITLSPKAAAKLSSSGETITIAAMYGGPAKPGVPTEGDGMVFAGEELSVTAGAGNVLQGGIMLDEKEVAKIDGEVELLINVYTSRTKFEDNLLSCGIWQDKLSAIPQDTPIPISCALIEE